jgi:hypothetical protein
VLSRIRGQIADRAFQQGSKADPVSPRVMVERNRHLDQSLKKPALRLGRSAPDALENLVGFIEAGGIN